MQCLTLGCGVTFGFFPDVLQQIECVPLPSWLNIF